MAPQTYSMTENGINEEDVSLGVLTADEIADSPMCLILPSLEDDSQYASRKLSTWQELVVIRFQFRHSSHRLLNRCLRIRMVHVVWIIDVISDLD
jgi:hypothetical protein